jgi:hydroxyethylthiazole kinase
MSFGHFGPEASHVWKDLCAVREKKPLIHCITNLVSINLVANAVLAVGASPVMASAAEEVKEITAASEALLINTGTLTPAAAEAMRAAVSVSAGAGKSVVIDPVGAGASSYRRGIVNELLNIAPPSVIRANASEIIALAGKHIGGGVDSIHKPQEALQTAVVLAEKWKCTVIVSGALDYVISQQMTVSIANGSPLMRTVTGTGCVAGALAAAFAAVCPDPFRAAVSSSAVTAVAGQLAAEKAAGPGTFQSCFLDSLYSLNADILDSTARLRIPSGK